MLYDQFRKEKSDFSNIRERISVLAKKLFDWNPPKLFFRNENPVIGGSDDEQTFSKLVSDQIQSSDVILTTPGQLDLFEGNKKSLFDINPTHLERIKNSKQLLSSNIWWCDIFNKRMFSALLNKVNPSIINITNIPEYSPNLETLSETLNVMLESDSLRGLIWSRHGDLLNLSESHHLSQMLKDKGINVAEYIVNEHECIYWANLKKPIPDTH